MRTLSESRWLRYLTFAALYFAQGVPWGFISVGYVVYLTDLGFDNTAVGSALGLAYVPWSFKVAWGPIIDRFPSRRFGRRRHFIIAAEALMGLTMLGLLFVDPKHQVGLVGAVLFLHNTFAAMQDVATDALAVDVLPEHERGGANSVMWAAKSAGVAAGGGAGTVLAKHLGWPALFSLIALAIWLVMVVVIAIPERPAGEAAERAAEEKLKLRVLWKSFAHKTAVVGVAISLLAPASYGLVGAVFTRLLRAKLHLSEESIGTISGVVDPISAVVGALIGGFVADRFGTRRVMAGFMLAIAATFGAFAVLQAHWTSTSFLVGWVIANSLTIAAYSAAALGFFMTLSNPAVGATQFAVFMAATNLTYAWASPAGGFIADHFGVPATYLVAMALELAAIGLLPFCDPEIAERRFHGEARASSTRA